MTNSRPCPREGCREAARRVAVSHGGDKFECDDGHRFIDMGTGIQRLPSTGSR